jgi:hypothetical protein
MFARIWILQPLFCMPMITGEQTWVKTSKSRFVCEKSVRAQLFWRRAPPNPDAGLHVGCALQSLHATCHAEICCFLQNG